MAKRYKYFVSWVFRKATVGLGYDNGVFDLSNVMTFKILKGIEEQLKTESNLDLVTILNFTLMSVADISDEKAVELWGKNWNQANEITGKIDF